MAIIFSSFQSIDMKQFNVVCLIRDSSFSFFYQINLSRIFNWRKEEREREREKKKKKNINL